MSATHTQSLPWRSFAGCFGKIAYITAGKAHEVLKSMKRRHLMRKTREAPDSQLTVYHCRFCGHYHLGNSG